MGKIWNWLKRRTQSKEEVELVGALAGLEWLIKNDPEFVETASNMMEKSNLDVARAAETMCKFMNWQQGKTIKEETVWSDTSGTLPFYFFKLFPYEYIELKKDDRV